MATIDPKIIAKYDPIRKFTDNPNYNPELNALRKAYQVASKYTGSVPGGRTSPYLANALVRAFAPDGIKDPITGEFKEIPGYIGNLSDNIFEVLKSDSARLDITIRAISLQREALKKQEAQKQEDKAYLRKLLNPQAFPNPENSNDETPVDPKKRVQEFLERIGLKKPPKDPAYKTSLPNISDIHATEKLSFDQNSDSISDIKDIPKDTSISTNLITYISLVKSFDANNPPDISITAQLQKIPPSTPPTHVAIKLAGALEKYVDTSDPDINVIKTRLKFPEGTLSLAGADLERGKTHYLTWNEFNQLHYQPGEKETLDTLSVVAFNDLDGDATLSAGDQRGEFQSITLEGSSKINNGLDNNQAISETVVQLPANNIIKRFEVDINANNINANFLADLDAGLLQIQIYEIDATPSYQRKYATLDRAASLGNKLVFNFDDEISDKLAIRIVRQDPSIQINSLTLVP